MKGRNLWESVRDLSPRGAFLQTVDLPPGTTSEELAVSIETEDGRELLRYSPRPNSQIPAQEPAIEPASPGDITNDDELYVTGLHLEQYRHATRHPEVYWLEALRRDPGDSRCNNALGLWHLRRGGGQQGEKNIYPARQRLTPRQPKPPDRETHHKPWLTPRFPNPDDQTYTAIYQA